MMLYHAHSPLIRGVHAWKITLWNYWAETVAAFSPVNPSLLRSRRGKGSKRRVVPGLQNFLDDDTLSQRLCERVEGNIWDVPETTKDFAADDAHFPFFFTRGLLAFRHPSVPLVRPSNMLTPFQQWRRLSAAWRGLMGLFSLLAPRSTSACALEEQKKVSLLCGLCGERGLRVQK